MNWTGFLMTRTVRRMLCGSARVRLQLMSEQNLTRV